MVKLGHPIQQIVPLSFVNMLYIFRRSGSGFQRNLVGGSKSLLGVKQICSERQQIWSVGSNKLVEGLRSKLGSIYGGKVYLAQLFFLPKAWWGYRINLNFLSLFNTVMVPWYIMPLFFLKTFQRNTVSTGICIGIYCK